MGFGLFHRQPMLDDVPLGANNNRGTDSPLYRFAVHHFFSKGAVFFHDFPFSDRTKGRTVVYTSARIYYVNRCYPCSRPAPRLPTSPAPIPCRENHRLSSCSPAYRLWDKNRAPPFSRDNPPKNASCHRFLPM